MADPQHPTPLPRPRPVLTLARARTIRAAMRSFLDDALTNGAPLPPRWCDRCRDLRSAAGGIAYQGTDLCNRCATAYELYRAAGLVRAPEEFVAHQPARSRPRPASDRKEQPHDRATAAAIRPGTGGR